MLSTTAHGSGTKRKRPVLDFVPRFRTTASTTKARQPEEQQVGTHPPLSALIAVAESAESIEFPSDFADRSIPTIRKESATTSRQAQGSETVPSVTNTAARDVPEREVAASVESPTTIAQQAQEQASINALYSAALSVKFPLGFANRQASVELSNATSRQPQWQEGTETCSERAAPTMEVPWDLPFQDDRVSLKASTTNAQQSLEYETSPSTGSPKTVAVSTEFPLNVPACKLSNSSEAFPTKQTLQNMESGTSQTAFETGNLTPLPCNPHVAIGPTGYAASLAQRDNIVLKESPAEQLGLLPDEKRSKTASPTSLHAAYVQNEGGRCRLPQDAMPSNIEGEHQRDIIENYLTVLQENLKMQEMIIGEHTKTLNASATVGTDERSSLQDANLNVNRSLPLKKRPLNLLPALSYAGNFPSSSSAHHDGLQDVTVGSFLIRCEPICQAPYEPYNEPNTADLDTTGIPKFAELVNFPENIGNPYDCAMCGQLRPITIRNNGVCVECETLVWKVVETGTLIKWCHGRKKFVPFASDGRGNTEQ